MPFSAEGMTKQLEYILYVLFHFITINNLSKIKTISTKLRMHLPPNILSVRKEFTVKEISQIMECFSMGSIGNKEWTLL